MHGILNELRDIGIQGEGRAHVGIIVPCICGIKMPGSSAGRLPTAMLMPDGDLSAPPRGPTASWCFAPAPAPRNFIRTSLY